MTVAPSTASHPSSWIMVFTVSSGFPYTLTETAMVMIGSLSDAGNSPSTCEWVVGMGSGRGVCVCGGGGVPEEITGGCQRC